MRATIIILLLLISLSACSKQDNEMAVPIKKEASDKNELPDKNVSITGFSGKWDGNTIHLQFGVNGDLSGVTAFKIFSGSVSNQLCLIGEIQVNNADTPVTFSFSDQHPKGATTYYLIGIENDQGQITYLNNILSIPKQAGSGK